MKIQLTLLFIILRVIMSETIGLILPNIVSLETSLYIVQNDWIWDIAILVYNLIFIGISSIFIKWYRDSLKKSKYLVFILGILDFNFSIISSFIFYVLQSEMQKKNTLNEN